MKKIIFMLIFIPFLVHAHPVAFQDSVGLMGYHSRNISYNQINYSFKPWFAVGVHHITTRLQSEKLSQDIILSSNFLLKRWNGPSFQANIYASLGVGKSKLKPKNTIGYNQIQFDIEDRKYYFLIKKWSVGSLKSQRFTFNRQQSDIEQTVVRIGFAPYQDKFSGLHSWIILEWKKTLLSQENSTEELTPIVRLFYKNLLFEIGQSFSGNMTFNYITHF